MDKIQEIIKAMNEDNRMGVDIMAHLMRSSYKRREIINAFRALGFVVKAIGSRVYVSDGPPATEAKKREWERNIRGLSSILW